MLVVDFFGKMLNWEHATDSQALIVKERADRRKGTYHPLTWFIHVPSCLRASVSSCKTRGIESYLPGRVLQAPGRECASVWRSALNTVKFASMSVLCIPLPLPPPSLHVGGRLRFTGQRQSEVSSGSSPQIQYKYTADMVGTAPGLPTWA